MPNEQHPPLPRQESITVADLVQKLRDQVHIKLENLNSCENLEDRVISEVELHRPGLALAGYVELFTWKRIQIIGNTETQYLNRLDYTGQVMAFSNLTDFSIPIIFVTSGNSLSEHLIQMSEKHGIPIVSTPIETTEFMFILRDFLEDQFALQTMLHGSMVDVYGIGMLIMGKSGIGKSEVALDLIERGHRLVADDAVMITKKSNVLMASANDMNKHFMEIRGLGIIDVMSMFGIRAIRYQKRLEVIVDLCLWNEAGNIDRTGLEKSYKKILNIDIPTVTLPITPGKNITVIAEVIAMNHLLSHYGYDAAQVFKKRIEQRIKEKTKNRGSAPRRAIEYFEGDFE